MRQMGLWTMVLASLDSTIWNIYQTHTIIQQLHHGNHQLSQEFQIRQVHLNPSWIHQSSTELPTHIYHVQPQIYRFRSLKRLQRPIRKPATVSSQLASLTQSTSFQAVVDMHQLHCYYNRRWRNRCTCNSNSDRQEP